MRLMVYQLIGANTQFLSDKKDSLYQALLLSKEFTDDRGIKYCINNVSIDGYIISATLSQEYIGGLTTVVNKVETPISSNPWEKTYLFIDIVTSMLLLQKRRYSPKTLDHNKAESRILEILRGIFLEQYSSTLEIYKTSIGYNKEYFKDIIRSEIIKEIAVTNLKGTKVPIGTSLHNPKEQWDRVFAESFNEYDSEVVEEIVVKASSDKDLSRSVIAKLAIAAEGSDIKGVAFIDPEENKKTTLTKKSAGSVFVNVDPKDDTETVKKEAIEKINASRDSFRKFGNNRML